MGNIIKQRTGPRSTIRPGQVKWYSYILKKSLIAFVTWRIWRAGSLEIISYRVFGSLCYRLLSLFNYFNWNYGTKCIRDNNNIIAREPIAPMRNANIAHEVFTPMRLFIYYFSLFVSALRFVETTKLTPHILCDQQKTKNFSLQLSYLLSTLHFLLHVA